MLSIITSAGGNISGWGLVGMFVMLVGFGGLIPRWQYKQVLRDKEDQLNEFRAIHAADLERANIQTQQITRLLDASETTTHLINTLQRELSEEPIPGYRDDPPRSALRRVASQPHTIAAPHTNGDVAALPQGGIDARSVQHLITTNANNVAELRTLRDYIAQLHAHARNEGLAIDDLEFDSPLALPDSDHTHRWGHTNGHPGTPFGPLESDDH